jgi:OOP family OmpA-OmpF porin
MKTRFMTVLALAAILVLPLLSGCANRCANCGQTIKVTVLEGVNFDFDKSVLKPEGKAILEKDVELLKKDKTLDISVEGHCDIMGSDEYNQKLSERRAKVVSDYFVSQGIDAGRMKTIGYGRKQPVVPNDTDANRAKNRRVEVRIIKARP